MTTSLITQRVLHQAADVSIALGDYRTGVYAMTYVAGQKLYVGTSAPMNSLWLELATAAVIATGAPVVEVWYNQSWVAVVDVIEETAAMTVSGRISWSLDLFQGWDYEQLSTTVGIANTSIFNRYWLRISWPNNFSATIGFIGQKFSNDLSFASTYPDLMQPAILTGFKAGKTNWNEQHFMSAEFIVKDLRRRNIILKRGQIMDWTVFEEASNHKVAELVYQAFGAAYKDQAIEARKKYEIEMSTRTYVIDVSMDGHLSDSEAEHKSGWMTR